MSVPRRPRGAGALPITCCDCFAWGVLPSRRCMACSSFRYLHPDEGPCTGCGRVVPVKKDYCRLCWCQASADAKGVWTPTLLPYLQQVRHHQLFFAKMHRHRPRSGQPRLSKQARRPETRPLSTSEPSAPSRPTRPWVQPPLFEAGRDFTAFDRRRYADFTNPWLIRAQREARSWGQARGWPERVRREVDRALVIVLSGSSGEKIRHSDLFAALSRRALGALRPAEILDRLGLLDDDRPAQLDTWLARKLTDVAPGIRHAVEHWLRTLVNGGARTQPRSLPTAWNYLNVIRPILIDWSSRYHHLREVTRDDILAAATTASGAARRHLLSALRSLFRHCKKSGTIFRDPAARVRVGRHDYGVLLPLQPEQIGAALVAVSSPVARLAIALAGVHAARPHAILAMRVDDVELGDRRLTIAGRIRPLDDLTRHVLVEWLEYRRARWPITANPHLIINQRTALDDRPASKVWLTQALRGHAATLERLRVDRQLDEALTRGADPLHLAAVFGLDDKTAIRYAAAARQILETEAEQKATGNHVGGQP